MHHWINHFLFISSPQDGIVQCLFQCDATWSTEVYDTFSEYINGKMLSSTTGHGIEINPKARVEIDGIALKGRRSNAQKNKDSNGGIGTDDGVGQ